jgi:TolB-like protein
MFMQSPIAKSFVRVLRGLVVILVLMAALPAHGSSETLKMAVLPWNVHAGSDLAFLRGALTDMLTTRLGAEADIAVARADRVKEALGAAKDENIRESTAIGVGKKLGLDYVLYGSVTVIGRAVSLDASVVDVRTGKVTPFASTGPSPDSIVAMADNLARKIVHHFYPERAMPVEAAKAPAPPAPRPAPVPAPVPAPAPVAPGAPATGVSSTPPGVIIKPRVRTERGPGAPDFWKSNVLKGQFISMTVADLDGNGEKEFFLLEKDALTVARKEGKELRVVQKIRSTSGLEFVSLAAVDTDGDGTVEVYVSALEHLTASSAVVEYGGGAYSLRKEGIGWLLREARGEDDRPLLIGQRFRSSDGFYGGVDILKKSGDRVVRAGAYLETLPHGVNLYNFTYFNFNVKEPSQKYLLAFDKEGRLLVYTRKKRGWSVYWKSKEYYGGTMHRIEFNSDTSSSETYRYVDVERPLFHMDTDGDGHDELIVRQSRAVGLFKRYAKVFKSFSGGAIVSLTWDGEFLTEAWRTREINGYIADFFIDDLSGSGSGGRKLVMIVQMDSSILSAGVKSYMLIYDLAITPPPAPPNPLIR